MGVLGGSAKFAGRDKSFPNPTERQVNGMMHTQYPSNPSFVTSCI